MEKEEKDEISIFHLTTDLMSMKPGAPMGRKKKLNASVWVPSQWLLALACPTTNQDIAGLILSISVLEIFLGGTESNQPCEQM